jgi:segregation and condensation protein A
MTVDYRVELDRYSGPMDLLLFLVRRSELDLLDLPIAEITAQFQRYLAALQFLDLDQVGDFVVMASTLLEIKSRLALPTSEAEEEIPVEPVDDPRSGLIQQLLEYKRIKEGAKLLEEQGAASRERYPRLTDERPDAVRDQSADRIKGVELWDLVSALSRVLERRVIEEESKIRYDDTPISVYVEQIGAKVREAGRIGFTMLFDNASQRSRIISIFLAILELLRHHGFAAEQAEPFGEIWIVPPDAEQASNLSAPDGIVDHLPNEKLESA